MYSMYVHNYIRENFVYDFSAVLSNLMCGISTFAVQMFGVRSKLSVRLWNRNNLPLLILYSFELNRTLINPNGIKLNGLNIVENKTNRDNSMGDESNNVPYLRLFHSSPPSKLFLGQIYL
jgi:hypothetical protein